MKDPEFLEQAKKISLEVEPYSGQEITTFIENVEKAPQDLIDRIAKLIEIPQ